MTLRRLLLPCEIVIVIVIVSTPPNGAPFTELGTAVSLRW
ncbi:hypothetical protein TIFTF001_014032 [Ficus carica]|uniref:Uncharacterized protein n=1 Tax=Ficus carica TaxID=3494 RepID=A0AA88D6L5_FICCA|nr:hypothetical protein TIFTF001_014032 [Ficus carica]